MSITRPGNNNWAGNLLGAKGVALDELAAVLRGVGLIFVGAIRRWRRGVVGSGAVGADELPGAKGLAEAAAEMARATVSAVAAGPTGP